MMTKKLTIGYVLDDTLDRSDGVQQAVITIGEKMRSLGHDVHYIVPYTERVDIQNIHSVAKVISLKFNGNSIRTPIWSSKKRIKALFSDVEFDVLHIQMPYSPFMAARVIHTAPRSTRIIGTFHILPYNWLARYGTKLLGLVLWKNKKLFSHSYAVSKPALDFMERDFGLRGTVLGNPVNYQFFNDFASKQQNRRKRIVFIGRFEERKGVRLLLEAYLSMKNRNSTELIMCGAGPLWNDINSNVNYQLPNIKFPGFVTEEEKAQYLSSATVAVFPSTAGESFGIVLTEAMSAGAGVTIGGNNPGYASVLGEWPETLFDPNNIDLFAAKLDLLIENDNLRNDLGKKQHRAVKQYDTELICKKLITTYCEPRQKQA
jgi:phosphatidyl-myo-inositol alpha-mannosyltransferase